MEQEQIMTAPRGQAFTVMGPSSRSTFRVEVPEPIVDMFQEDEYESRYFSGEGGLENWEEFVGGSRALWLENRPEKQDTEEKENAQEKNHVLFTELTEEEAIEQQVGSEVEQILGLNKHVQFEEINEPEPEEPKEVSQPEPEPEEPKEVSRPEPEVTDRQAASEPQQPTELEKLLTQALGQFSHAAMVEEIKKAVREEVLKEMEDLKPVIEETKAAAEQAKMAADTSASQVEEKPEEFIESEEEKPEKSIDMEDEDDLSWLLGDEDTFSEEESPADEDEDERFETEDSKREDESDDMDIMDILMQQAEDMETVSAIDMMDIYDEKVVDISLEDLANYIVKHR